MDKLGVISGLKNWVNKFGWKFGEKIGWKNSMEKLYVKLCRIFKENSLLKLA